MKILVVCQHYYPEPFRISDMCEELTRLGHEVTVITGVPNYPMGRIYDGYKKRQNRRQNINGVDVHRCFTIGRRSGILFRVLNYYSFAISSKLHALKMRDNFDIVFVNQLSPVMMANAGVAYKKKHGKKLVIYTLDLWPESLAVGGIKAGSLPYKYFHRVSEKIYQSADEILVSSKNFIGYFKEHFGIPDKKLFYMPQYAEDMFSEIAAEKVDKPTVDLMFAGNIGKAQSIDTIVEAARLLTDKKKLRFHIVGDGSELDNTKKLAENYGLDNIIFHGRHPLEEMPVFYRNADALIVTLEKNPIISRVLPGKVQSYMAAGKPLIGAIDGAAKEVIEESGCGFVAEAENAEQLSEMIREFCALSAEQREILGKNGREYYDSYFTKNVFMKTLLSHLEK